MTVLSRGFVTRWKLIMKTRTLIAIISRKLIVLLSKMDK